MREKRALGFYNYTVVLTYLGMLISFVGIACVLEGHIRDAMVCLMLSGVCDMFDGSIAATRKRTHQEKRFGIQIDSLSDLICFGVFPGVLVYVINGKSAWAFGAAALYVLCALIRLAYFNVTEEERQDGQDGPREWFLGLPVTTAALFLPAAYIIGDFGVRFSTVMYAVMLCMMAVAFLSPFKIRKPYLAGKAGIFLAGVIEFFALVAGTGLRG